jgi:trehalose 6-phosphate synthase
VVEARGGAWVGWDSAADAVPPQHGGIELFPRHLSTNDTVAYYEGYSNSTLWPLHHDCLEPPELRRAWWQAYARVNRVFAGTTARAAADGATVWVHDYHLQLVPALVRKARSDVRIGFFLHIPVPTVDTYRRLPQAVTLLRGVLGADVVGLQTAADAGSFLSLVHEVLGLEVGDDEVWYDDRRVEVRGFPSSVDVDYIETRAAQAAAAGEVERVRHRLGDPRQIVLGVERLDFTKGVERRLAAYRQLLACGRVNPTETTMVQVLSPSRMRIPRYRQLRERIAAQVRHINAEFGTPDRPAVHYWDRPLTLDELVPLYRAADVMAVTPLRDGMNLVAKEYVASRADLGGALVLSTFAGAAYELSDAFLVDPFDDAALMDVIAHALAADPAERTRRMRRLRGSLAVQDAQRWGRDFLGCLEADREPVGSVAGRSEAMVA